MSRMQDALSREDYDCANYAVPVAVMLEANTPEPSDERQNRTPASEPDRGRLSRSDILWIVRHPVPRRDRTRPGDPSQPNSPRVERKTAPKGRKRPDRGPVSIPRVEQARLEPSERQAVALAAQVKSFQERSDLRECLIPGMLSKISPKACEGWQHQATVRTSRVMAKMKLDSCKNCPHRLQAEQAQG
jgi:hypothetical protein